MTNTTIQSSNGHKVLQICLLEPLQLLYRGLAFGSMGDFHCFVATEKLAQEGQLLYIWGSYNHYPQIGALVLLRKPIRINLVLGGPWFLSQILEQLPSSEPQCQASNHNPIVTLFIIVNPSPKTKNFQFIFFHFYALNVYSKCVICEFVCSAYVILIARPSTLCIIKLGGQ